MFDITTERPEDGAAIEALLDAAFDPWRHAKVSYRYRDGVSPAPSLRLTARLRQRVVGTVRCWPIMVGEDDVPALLLGPLAVDAAHRNIGIGTALVRRLLDMAAAQGHRLVFLVGDLDYYWRFGFRPAAAHGFVMPDERPERLSVNELAPGALAAASGILKPWRSLRAGGAWRRVVGRSVLGLGGDSVVVAIEPRDRHAPRRSRGGVRSTRNSG